MRFIVPREKFLPGLRGRITAVFFAAWLSDRAGVGDVRRGTVLVRHAPAGRGVSGDDQRSRAHRHWRRLITSLVILAIARTRPDLLERKMPRWARHRLGISGVRSGHRAGAGDFRFALRLRLAGRTGQGGGEIRLCRPRRHAHQNVDSRLQNARHQFGRHRHGDRGRARHAGHVRPGVREDDRMLGSWKNWNRMTFEILPMKKETATRFSVSLPPALLDQLDEMTRRKGLRQPLARHRGHDPRPARRAPATK